MAGGFGRFQLFMMISYIMGFICANFVLYNIDYLTQLPSYLCELPPYSGQIISCTSDQICGAKPPVNYTIDWTDPNSLDNWAISLDLMCVSDDDVERISSVYYFGEIFGCLVIARIPDLLGRKWPFIVSIALQLPCYIAILCSTSLELTTYIAFFMGILHIGIANGGYINVCEYVQDKWKNHVCTLMLVFDMFSVIITGIYWKYISVDATWLLAFGILLNFLSLLGVLFVPESPEYLYSFFRFRECREVILQIAKWNKRDLGRKLLSREQNEKEDDSFYEDEYCAQKATDYRFDVEVELRQIFLSNLLAKKNENYVYSMNKENEYNMEQQIQRSMKAGIKQFFKEKDLVINLFLSMALWTVTCMNYQINDYYPNYFPNDDQYENTIAISTVELME